MAIKHQPIHFGSITFYTCISGLSVVHNLQSEICINIEFWISFDWVLIDQIDAEDAEKHNIPAKWEWLQKQPATHCISLILTFSNRSYRLQSKHFSRLFDNLRWLDGISLCINSSIEPFCHTNKQTNERTKQKNYTLKLPQFIFLHIEILPFQRND